MSLKMSKNIDISVSNDNNNWSLVEAFIGIFIASISSEKQLVDNIFIILSY